MPLIDSRVRGQAIKVPISLNIPDPNSLSTTKNYIQRLVIIGAELIFQLDKVSRDHIRSNA